MNHFSPETFQMLNRLARRTEPNKLLFLGELIAGGKELKPKMDELVSVAHLINLVRPKQCRVKVLINLSLCVGSHFSEFPDL